MVKVQVTHLLVSLRWWRQPIPEIELLQSGESVSVISGC